MSVILTTLLLLLLAVFVVLLAAFVMPFRIELVVTKQEEWRVRAAWRAFGRFGPRISMARSETDEHEPKPKKRSKAGSKLRADPKRVVQAFVRFGSDILRRIKIDVAKLDMRFGTGDPAETGQVFGLLAPLIYGSAASTRMSVNVEPVFDETILRGRAELDLSIVPASLLAPAARFGWSAFGPSR